MYARRLRALVCLFVHVKSVDYMHMMITITMMMEGGKRVQQRQGDCRLGHSNVIKENARSCQMNRECYNKTHITPWLVPGDEHGDVIIYFSAAAVADVVGVVR